MDTRPRLHWRQALRGYDELILLNKKLLTTKNTKAQRKHLYVSHCEKQSDAAILLLAQYKQQGCRANLPRFTRS